MKALTFKQYKLIDLTLLSALFIIAEALVTVAGRKWFPGQPYALSLSIFFFCLGLMRWGAASFVFPIAGGLTYCLATAFCMEQAVPLENIAVYCIGNLFMLLGLLVFGAFGKEKVRTKTLYTILFVVCVYLVTEFGRFCVSYLLVERDIAILPTFLATDSLSGVFALILVLLIRKTDGLFEDQKTYLLRLDAEKKQEQEAEDEFANRI